MTSAGDVAWRSADRSDSASVDCELLRKDEQREDRRGPTHQALRLGRDARKPREVSPIAPLLRRVFGIQKLACRQHLGQDPLEPTDVGLGAVVGLDV